MRYSIITINYNDKEGLSRTIKSVINQTSKNFEYIVIDGGSTDGSVDIIKQNIDYINYWVSEKDKGVYNAMNKGIAQAKGDYLVFMNAGDCFHTPDILELMCDYQEDIICGKVFKVDLLERHSPHDLIRTPAPALLGPKPLDPPRPGQKICQ